MINSGLCYCVPESLTPRGGMLYHAFHHHNLHLSITLTTCTGLSHSPPAPDYIHTHHLHLSTFTHRASIKLLSTVVFWEFLNVHSKHFHAWVSVWFNTDQWEKRTSFNFFIFSKLFLYFYLYHGDQKISWWRMCRWRAVNFEIHLCSFGVNSDCIWRSTSTDPICPNLDPAWTLIYKMVHFGSKSVTLSM